MTEEETKAAEEKKAAEALAAKQAEDAAKGEPKTFDESYVKELRSEAAKHRTAAKETQKKLDELEAWKKEQEDKEKTELQKATDEKAKLEAQVADLTARQKDILIKADFTIAASKAGITDIDAAYKLADLDQIKVDEDGKMTGLSEAIDALAKERPYLVGGDAPQPSTGNPPKKGDAEDPLLAAFESGIKPEKKEAPAK